MNDSSHNNKNNANPLKYWTETKSNYYGSILIGIIIMLFFTILILSLYLTRGIVFIYDPNTYSGESSEVEIGSTSGNFCVGVSLILHNLLGFVFILVAISRKNCLFKFYEIDQQVNTKQYSLEKVNKIFFNLWIYYFKQKSINFHPREYKGYKFKRGIIIPEKNIYIIYYLANSDKEPHKKYVCHVEIKPFSNSSIFSNTLKYINKTDLLEIVRIIDQIINPNLIREYFQKY